MWLIYMAYYLSSPAPRINQNIFLSKFRILEFQGPEMGQPFHQLYFHLGPPIQTWGFEVAQQFSKFPHCSYPKRKNLSFSIIVQDHIRPVWQALPRLVRSKCEILGLILITFITTKKSSGLG